MKKVVFVFFYFIILMTVVFALTPINNRNVSFSDSRSFFAIEKGGGPIGKQNYNISFNISKNSSESSSYVYYVQKNSIINNLSFKDEIVSKDSMGGYVAGQVFIKKKTDKK